MNNIADKIDEAAELIRYSSRTVAFTGAGVSVESGIPPFRGENGLWNKYDPGFLDINYFHQYPEKSWPLIKEIFYDFFGQARPNAAHFSLAKMEEEGVLHSLITQNIDNLHQIAGSTQVCEFHGNSRNLVCTNCGEYYPVEEIGLLNLPPKCSHCGSILKPDFVFFGEPIPEPAHRNSFKEAVDAETFILIGTTGEIMPASLIPFEAKRNGKKIIEINIVASNYTSRVTDVFLEGKATIIMGQLLAALNGSDL